MARRKQHRSAPKKAKRKPAWRAYQEKAANFFRSLGLTAETDATLRGVRTEHDIDVLVTSHLYGFKVIWLVECKHWKRRVSKLHVLALRNIVTDVGADKGILLCESGVQSGSLEAASLTNVQITSLADLSVTAREQISAVRLRELHDQVEKCHRRYWDIPKEKRIDDDLRPDVGSTGYSACVGIDYCRDLIRLASLGRYPFESEELASYLDPEFPRELKSASEVVQTLDTLIKDLQKRLTASDGKKP